MKWHGYILVESPFCDPFIGYHGAFRWRWMTVATTYIMWFFKFHDTCFSNKILISQNPDVKAPIYK